MEARHLQDMVTKTLAAIQIAMATIKALAPFRPSPPIRTMGWSRLPLPRQML